MLSVSGGRAEGAGGADQEIREVRIEAPPREDSTDGVWATSPGGIRKDGRAEAGDVRLSWIHAYLQTKPEREIHGPGTNDAEAPEAQPEEGGDVVSEASA